MLDVARVVFPDYAGDAPIMLANHIKVNGWTANAGDVVSCMLSGEQAIGNLLLSAVVVETGAERSYSIISMWQMAADDPA